MVLLIYRLVLVDAGYKFLLVDFRTNGRANKSGILQILERGKLNLPPPNPLPDCHLELPFVIVGGNDAFPLKL